MEEDHVKLKYVSIRKIQGNAQQSHSHGESGQNKIGSKEKWRWGCCKSVYWEYTGKTGSFGEVLTQTALWTS